MEKTINECFFQIQNGANIKQGDVEGGFPITRIETTANDKFNRDRMGYAGITDISKYEAYVLEDGDLLMSHINSVQYLGRTVLYVKQPDETIIHGMNLLRLKARRNIINPSYARYCFYGHTFRCRIGNITKKSVNQASFAVKDLKQIKIEVPSLDVQNKVVVILDRVQKLIDMRNKELATLDELIKARFVEMFGDPELNPMGWEQVTLNDVCSSIVRGPFGSALKKEFFVEPDETTYKVYEQKHAIQKSASIGTYYITEEKYQELKRFECLPGDILMSCSGTMGELYQLPDGCEKGVINQALCKFTLNERILPICFLVYMKQTIGNLETKGSGIQNIAAVSYVKQMPINLPPMDVQNEFEQFVHQVDKSKVAVQKALDEAQQLFDSLMQEYFG